MVLLGRLFRRKRKSGSVESLRRRLQSFRSLVDGNNRVLELIADAGEMLGGEYVFDVQYLRSLAERFEEAVRGVVDDLDILTDYHYRDLAQAYDRIRAEIRDILEYRTSVPVTELVLPLAEIDSDAADAVGEKMARLGEIDKRLQCPVPDGFAVTAFACRRFLQQDALAPLVEEWRAAAEKDGKSAGREAAERLQTAILRAPIPADLERAIGRAAADVRKRTGCELFAVRSSALGEDGPRASFAGQYATKLWIPAREIGSAYREVVASLFTPSVASYRRRMGGAAGEYVMPVGCLCMVDARCAGVLHTLDPSDPGADVMPVEAVRGIGKSVAEGSGPVERFYMLRRAPGALVPRPAAGAAQERESCSPPALAPAEARELASAALRIERYLKCAQEIEWAIDRQGRLFILQARPLAVAVGASEDRPRREAVADRHHILMERQGSVACRGVAAGRVHVVQEGSDLDDLRDEVVLVARASSPRLSAALARAAAVITDLGTTTGHLATIAREFRVPMIVDAGNATRLLPEGAEVTVDAEDNVVYEGTVHELLREHLYARASDYQDAEEFRILRKMLKKIAPLHLNDPQAPEFRASRCASYHDIIRFAHEKAVEYLIAAAWLARESPAQYARRLESTVPLDLVVVDLGGGMHPGGGATVRTEEVTCVPLQALLEGLQAPGAWPSAPADMDLDGFMSSATRVGSLMPAASARPLQNLAIVSNRYLHLSLHLGYHFNIVDCYAGEAPNDNLIYFRFAGGATELARRERRVEVLKSILMKHDFVVEAKGDLLIARIKKIPARAVLERLQMIGRLIGCTRQLDVYLRDDAAIRRCVDRFMAGRCDLAGE